MGEMNSHFLKKKKNFRDSICFEGIKKNVTVILEGTGGNRTISGTLNSKIFIRRGRTESWDIKKKTKVGHNDLSRSLRHLNKMKFFFPKLAVKKPQKRCNHR